MKRVIIKNKLDHRFFCPYCKADIREVGLRFTEEALQSTSADYNDDGRWNDSNYGEVFDSDVVENSVECGNCEHRLNGIDPYEDLDLSNLWK